MLRQFDEVGVTEDAVSLPRQMVLNLMQMEAETNARSIGVPAIADIVVFATRFPVDQYFVMVDESLLRDDEGSDSMIQYFEDNMPDAFDGGSQSEWLHGCSKVTKGYS